MSAKSRREVLESARQRYRGRERDGRKRLLDEVCQLTGYERKYAIKLLGGKRPISGEERTKRGGSKPRYGGEELAVMREIWLASEQPCGKRLKAALPIWLPFYEQGKGALAEGVRERVLQASAATLDRLLRRSRMSLGSRRRCGTRPGTLLRSQIPIRTEHWDVGAPGYLEADTVAHCGESMAGEFCWSLTVTDVHTQWTETRAVANRGQMAVAGRIAEIETGLPFPILGFDTDNGGEFLNWHLVDYFRLRRLPVGFTRSRAYRKNDNARVEQKNWTHVRQLVGYGSFEGEHATSELNALYTSTWNPFRNFFCPVMKHLRTEITGSRKKRIYDQPATPYERLLASGQLTAENRTRLAAQYTKLNPFALRQSIEKRLARFLRLQVRRSSKLAA